MTSMNDIIRDLQLKEVHSVCQAMIDSGNEKFAGLARSILDLKNPLDQIKTLDMIKTLIGL